MKSYSTDEIWVSRLDGSDMHRLAYQAVRFAAEDEGLHDVSWKDEKTTSFIRGNVLYTYPVQ